MVKEIVQMFMKDITELHEEADWWCFDDHCSYNIHNYNSDDVAVFKVDVYPNAEGQDRPDYSTWETVATFNYNEEKKDE